MRAKWLFTFWSFKIHSFLDSLEFSPLKSSRRVIGFASGSWKTSFLSFTYLLWFPNQFLNWFSTSAVRCHVPLKRYILFFQSLSRTPQTLACTKITWGLQKTQIAGLHPHGFSLSGPGAQEFAFLTHSPGMLRLLVQTPHLENQESKPTSSSCGFRSWVE